MPANVKTWEIAPPHKHFVELAEPLIIDIELCRAETFVVHRGQVLEIIFNVELLRPVVNYFGCYVPQVRITTELMVGVIATKSHAESGQLSPFFASIA